WCGGTDRYRAVVLLVAVRYRVWSSSMKAWPQSSRKSRAKAYPAHLVFRRGSSSSRDCATTERGSACDGVRGMASLPAVVGTLDIRGAVVGVVLEGKILASHCQI